MTQAPVRPPAPTLRSRAPRPRPATRPDLPWRAAAVLALRTAGLGLVAVEFVVMVLWATEQGSTAGPAGAIRTGAAVWVAAHHAELMLGHAHLGIAPLGLTVLPAVLLYRGGGRLARDLHVRGPRALARLVTCAAVAYAILTALLCLLARGNGLSADPAEAFTGAGVLAMLAVGAGALRGQDWRPDLPARAVAVARGAALGLSVLVGVGAVLVALAVLVHHSGVTGTGAVVAPSISGTLGLALLDLLALPTAVVYGTSVLAGPGFAVGAGTSVNLGGAHLGGVPALPLLGALPATGDFPGAAFALLAVPVACGVLAGVVATRGAPAWSERCVRAALVGVVAGVAAALAAAVVGGAAGPGRLAVTGPSPWQVGFAVCAEIGGGALAVALIRGLGLRPAALARVRLPRTLRAVRVPVPRRARATGTGTAD